MKRTPIQRKLPAHRSCFSYTRIPQVEGGVVYRLFRRDQRRVLHAVMLTFHHDCDRQLIAKTLREARHRLRNLVDEIDLQIMGVS